LGALEAVGTLRWFCLPEPSLSVKLQGIHRVITDADLEMHVCPRAPVGGAHEPDYITGLDSLASDHSKTA
jgi:hypothetical protein